MRYHDGRDAARAERTARLARVARLVAELEATDRIRLVVSAPDDPEIEDEMHRLVEQLAAEREDAAGVFEAPIQYASGYTSAAVAGRRR